MTLRHGSLGCLFTPQLLRRGAIPLRAVWKRKTCPPVVCVSRALVLAPGGLASPCRDCGVRVFRAGHRAYRILTCLLRAAQPVLSPRIDMRMPGLASWTPGCRQTWRARAPDPVPLYNALRRQGLSLATAQPCFRKSRPALPN